MECSVIHHNVVINRLYESINPNVEEVVNDPEQNDRIVTRKDMASMGHWQYDEANDELYTSKKVKAGLGVDKSDYILSVGAQSDIINKTFDAQRLGDVLDISWIGKDEYNEEEERWVICSRSSGLWLGVISKGEDEDGELMVLSHVEGSPCCSKVMLIDIRQLQGLLQ